MERPATAMSTAHTTDIPAPAAQPGTAATTGTAHVAMAVTMPWNASARSPTYAPRSSAAANAFTSPPVQKLAPSLTTSAAPTSAGSALFSASAMSGSASPSRVPWRPRATRSRSTRPSRTTASLTRPPR